MTHKEMKIRLEGSGYYMKYYSESKVCICGSILSEKFEGRQEEKS